MSSSAARISDRAFTLAFALLVSAIACAIVVLAAPRPVAPDQLPALRLDGARVSAQLARDRALAARAPHGEDVDELLRLYRAEGEAEAAGDRDFTRLNTRRAALAVASRAVFARVDEEGGAALVAAVTERAIAALRGELPEAESRGLLGVFPKLLVRYGYADAEHRLRAPELSVRTFYKARFNLICERPADRDLTTIEREAYEGWNALHAGGLPPEQRAEASHAYFLAGGMHATEAEGIWLFQAGLHGAALSMFRRGYADTGSLRLRNFALYAARGE